MAVSPVFANAELEAELFGSPEPIEVEANSPEFQETSNSDLEAELFGSETIVDEGESESDGFSGGSDLEAELFGSSESSELDDVERPALSANHSLKELLSSKIESQDNQFFIGGRYYHSVSLLGFDNQKARDTGFSSDGIADIYFDAALDDGVRFFMKQKIQQNFSGDGAGGVVDFGGAPATTSIDQMWLKFNYQNSLYMTLGKQPTSWGSGFVWAPTDFLNEETESPFSLSDQRLGVSLVKFQYPMDAKGINLYSVFQTNEASTIGEIKSLVRAEKVFEQSEVALTFASQANEELQAGFDFSTGLKWFDVYFNFAATKNDQDVFFEAPPGADNLSSDDLLGLLQAGVDADPDAVPENAVLTPVDRSNEILKQVSTGLIYIKSFEDNSQLILNGEFFYNEKGYDNSDVLTLLLLQNPAAFDPLYFSRRYLAVGFTRAGLGSSSQSYGLQYIKNLSDTSGAVIASFGFKPFQDLSFSSNLIVFTGGSGTFNPLDADSDVIAETADRVADGELNIPDGALDNVPPFVTTQGADPITATIEDTDIQAPRYIVRTQFSLKF